MKSPKASFHRQGPGFLIFETFEICKSTTVKNWYFARANKICKLWESLLKTPHWVKRAKDQICQFMQHLKIILTLKSVMRQNICI